MNFSLNTLWWTVIGTSALAFTLKFIGQSVPTFKHPRIEAINLFIPVALLSALVAVQTVAVKTQIELDHRLAGLAVAAIALILKAPYFVVVLSAALTSAAIVNFF